MTKDRVISRLLGGVGNQLFQYAAGRALADRLGCDLVIDARYVAGSRDRGDCFAHFENARFIRSTDLPPAKSDGVLRYALWRGFGRSPRIYRENGKAFDPKVLELPKDTYLHGYWQSEKYFADIIDDIRSDLEFTTALNPENAEIADRISAAPTSVSFHVRRGDYLATGAYAACTPDYYRSAAAYLAERNKSLTCFVFTNDPAWVRENLDLGHETIVVDINDEASGHFDLRLQSICDHHVIANSTFSWWAAWLNPSFEKTVIAPRRWFTSQESDNPDLIPSTWIRL